MRAKLGPVWATLYGPETEVAMFCSRCMARDIEWKASGENGWDGYYRYYREHPLYGPQALSGLVLHWSGLFESIDNLPTPVEYRETIELRDYQDRALRKMLSAGRGIIKAPTGSGKTEVMCAHILSCSGDPGFRALVLCGTVDLVEQHVERLRGYGVSVGRFKEFITDEPSTVAVTTVAMLGRYSSRALESLLFPFSAVYVDETHHVAASTWAKVMKASSAVYRFGFSATPLTFNPRRDVLTVGLLGPVLEDISYSSVEEQGFLPERKVVLLHHEAEDVLGEWKDIYDTQIVDNPERNGLVGEVSRRLSESGMNVLILVERRIQGLKITDWLFDSGVETRYIEGQHSGKIPGFSKMEWSRYSADRLKSDFSEKKPMVAVATPVVSEGIDFTEVDAVIIAGGWKSITKVLQRMGRITRGKSRTVWIFDVYDSGSRVLSRHSAQRHAVYVADGCNIISSSDADGSLGGWLCQTEKNPPRLV